MFTEKAKLIFANLGLATIARNKLKTTNPDVACELVKVPAGVEIVRSPAAEEKQEPKPVATGELCTLHLRVKSESDQWLYLAEPLPNGSRWFFKGHMASVEDDGAGTWIVAVPSRLAKKKGWVGTVRARR